ncbi:type IX secretion system motor protein PorM/GldM [Jiulongibacter sediminis]|uniref:Gliding motility protein n=1 Tax=Jiulongibacter sediminis TaxID=1605367 RepID=A0A0P7C0J4_9BACT|nr:gliding motility protein GldM [Jiulongibacter sediminis]KPM47527.1 gliding motility protein [Jiulongibacter sediminis]TBX23321.1 gliding motility protein [Jiulongibacter sediminis]
MAGGKETPRQKMIGMMYLVLTAMLALQVSNSILQKFLTIDKSLIAANSSASESNERLIRSMEEAVENAGNKPEYVTLLEVADKVKSETSEINAYINELRNRIIEEAGQGYDEETGEIKNLAEEEKIANIFIGPANQKSGIGYELQNKLRAYTESLKTMSEGKVSLTDLAPDAKDDPAYANVKDPGEINKDFAEAMFASTPVPAALAALSQKQSEIKRQETEVLSYLASLVGAKEIKFDKIFAVVIPDSRTVVAGQTYKADVAIGAYSSAITPKISINGSPLAVVDGKGTYEVRAQGGQYDQNGQLKRSYTASISYPKPDGTTEQVTQEETYTVLKPSVEIQSASFPPLYLSCANKIVTSSSGLGSLYNPTFGGSGAEFIPGGGGAVTIVPNSAKVTLDVANDGVTLQTFPFRVRRVPKPTIEVLANNSPVDDNVSKRGLAAASVRTINVVAISDEDFKNNNPDDANYRVTDYSIFLASGTRPKGRLENVSGNQNISGLARDAQAGDRYVITVNKVLRRNFKGQTEEVNVGSVVKEIPLR